MPLPEQCRLESELIVPIPEIPPHPQVGADAIHLQLTDALWESAFSRKVGIELLVKSSSF